MTSETSLIFRIATEDWEFEAIHRLNYKTFVEEIPQHARNSEQRLVDKFHAENTYAICCDGDRLVGMVCGRVHRPFSLDAKVANLDSYLPPGRRLFEARLLSVERKYRTGQVFCGIVRLLAAHFREQGYDLAVISGTTRQSRLYRHLGFLPFGPVTGSGDALFQPMYLTLETFLEWSKPVAPEPPTVQRIVANFLPGPVDVREDVRRAFESNPISHRADAFMADFRSTRRLLCDLVNAQSVEILLGSGTLANDTVGGQLRLTQQPGLVLSNGEFGERLVDQATRWGLDHEVVRMGWGEPFDYAAVEDRLHGNYRLGWIWAVHSETSTGVLNDLAALKRIAARREVKLCLDCISSIGTVAIDLSGVYLATCVSGKALASFPGLSMVFYDHELPSGRTRLPRYLDLSAYASASGIPFTHSSNLVYALRAALNRSDWQAKFAQVADTAAWLRGQLRARQFRIVAADANAAPAVITLALPEDMPARSVGRELKRAGFLVSFQSEYLIERNWIQICLMGEWSASALAHLPDVLANLAAKVHHKQRDRLRTATAKYAGTLSAAS
jgi:aspartate aminotransferase-like enzyme